MLRTTWEGFIGFTNKHLRSYIYINTQQKETKQIKKLNKSLYLNHVVRCIRIAVGKMLYTYMYTYIHIICCVYVLYICIMYMHMYTYINIHFSYIDTCLSAEEINSSVLILTDSPAKWLVAWFHQSTMVIIGGAHTPSLQMYINIYIYLEFTMIDSLKYEIASLKIIILIYVYWLI